MRPTLRLVLCGMLFAVSAPAARAQFTEVTIDPALGRRPTFGPGGYITNGNGYRAMGPRGPGYYTGLYLPPNDLGNGPSPYYSPIYPVLASAPAATNPAPRRTATRPPTSASAPRRGLLGRVFRRP